MKDKTVNKITLLAILICSYCNAQTSDFIVTTSQDTIYVDKITLTDFEVKTKTGDKKKKYQMDEITSYYIFQENKHYQRITNEKKEVKAPDKYDYRRNENFYSEDYKNRIKYRFLQRLTHGKVKLFTEVVAEGALVVGISGSGVGAGMAARNIDVFYISIYDSKLELITDPEKYSLKLEFIIDDGTLKLRRYVYDILKIYLHGNEGITKQLDQLLLLKPVAGQDQIVNLVNEYNIWAGLNK